MLRGIRAVVALVAVLSFVVTAPVGADPGDPGEPIQLSAEMQQPFGQVIAYRLSPDGEWAVYVADQDFDRSYEVFSVSTSGGPVTRLNPPLDGNGDVVGFEISADSQYVVYAADPTTPGQYELFSVPIGGGESHRLHGDLATHGSVWRPFSILPDSSRAIFLAPEVGATGYRLLSAALDGSGTVELADVVGFNSEHAFEIATDGAHVIYRALSADETAIDLYMVPSAGGPAQRISVDLEPGTRIQAFDEAGGYVVYAAQAEGEDAVGIYVYPGASGPPQARHMLDEGQRVQGVFLADDGHFVSFPVAEDGLYGMNPAGGPAVRVSEPGLTVWQAPVYVPSQGRIVYRGTVDNARYHLYSATLDGSAITRLNVGDGDGDVDPDFQVTDDVVVLATPDFSDGGAALYSISIQGGTPVLVSAAADGTSVLSYDVSPSGDAVAYSSQDAQGNLELNLTPVTGGSEFQLATTVMWGNLFDIGFVTEDRLLFLGDLDVRYQTELWMVRTSAAAPQCLGRNATIVGTDGDDVLEGTPGPDVIWAGPGNDVVLARGGNDIVCGGAGNDHIRGNAGRDLLVGGAGDDVIRGGLGRDRLLGKGGADALAGQRGVDTLRGAAGADSLSGGMHIDRCFGGADIDTATACENVTAVP